MGDFEDKLSKILSSPEDMEKIMGMAKSLSGSLGVQTEESDSGDSGATDAGLGSMASMLGNIDPKLMRILGRVMGEYSSKTSDKTALISAIKPYLKEDRRAKIDKAADIAKLAHLARTALSEFSGGDDNV